MIPLDVDQARQRKRRAERTMIASGIVCAVIIVAMVML